MILSGTRQLMLIAWASGTVLGRRSRHRHPQNDHHRKMSQGSWDCQSKMMCDQRSSYYAAQRSSSAMTILVGRMRSAVPELEEDYQLCVNDDGS